MSEILHPPDRSPTARTVLLAWLGALPDDTSDALALLALEGIEQRDSYRRLALAAIARLRRQHLEIERLRGRYQTVLDELRRLRAEQRTAA